eukprot:4385413-Pyramimonas_sp.AAC.1
MHGRCIADAPPMHRRCIGDAPATPAMHPRRRRGENRDPHRDAPPMHRRRGAILRPIYPDPVWEA